MLLAANLESHGWCREAGADIDLPELFERGVVERRNGAVSQPKEDQSAAGRYRPAVVRVLEMHGFLDLAGHRIDGGQVALVAVGAAVPALVLAVLGGIDGDLGAGRHRRDIRPFGLRTVRGR